MSLLITSINKKRPMVQAFAKAAHNEGWRCYGSDLNLDVPAAKDVDALIQLPEVTDLDYKSALLRAVKENDIRLILPSRDGDLPILQSLTDDLKKLNCHLPLPDKNIVDLCQDKKLFSKFVTEQGLRAIPILEDVCGPELLYFTRPRYSSGSEGAYLVKSLEDAMLIAKSNDQLLHPLILNPEYTIDILSDFNANPLEAVCRRRLRVVNGESKWAQVEEQPILKKMAMQLAQKLSLKGHNIIQAFLTEEQEPVFIEANLRFGGASILSLKAGLKSPTALIKMAKGEAIPSHILGPVDYGLSLKREIQNGQEVDFFSSNEAFPKNQVI